MPCNLPTLLTWLRIILIPLFVSVFYLPDAVLSMSCKDGAAALIFILAAATDGFDGFVGREMTTLALREWMAQLGAHKHIAVNSLGKIKTVCQMVAIPLLLLNGGALGAHAP